MIKDILKFLSFVVFLVILLGACVLFLFGRSWGRVWHSNDEQLLDYALDPARPGYEIVEVRPGTGGNREPRRLTFTAQIDTPPQPLLCQGTAEGQGFDPAIVIVQWETLACVEQVRLVELARQAVQNDLMCHADPAAQVLHYWIDAGHIDLEDVRAPGTQEQVDALLAETARDQRVALFDPARVQEHDLAPGERRSEKKQQYILRCDGTLDLYLYLWNEGRPDFAEAEGDIFLIASPVCTQPTGIHGKAG